MKRKERAFWGFPLATALLLPHPLPFAVHPQSQIHHDPLPLQMENADHGDAHPKTGRGAR